MLKIDTVIARFFQLLYSPLFPPPKEHHAPIKQSTSSFRFLNPILRFIISWYGCTVAIMYWCSSGPFLSDLPLCGMATQHFQSPPTVPAVQSRLFFLRCFFLPDKTPVIFFFLPFLEPALKPPALSLLAPSFFDIGFVQMTPARLKKALTISSSCSWWDGQFTIVFSFLLFFPSAQFVHLVFPAFRRHEEVLAATIGLFLAQVPPL